MQQTICRCAGCKYHSSSNFCTLPKGYTVLNEFGQCRIFWAPNGQPRPQPLYPIEAEAPEEDETKAEE